MSLLLISAGVFLVLNVTWPVLKYELFLSPTLRRSEILSPISEKVKEQAVKNQESLKNPTTWFTNTPNLSDVSARVRYYNLSIPKLKITNATVEVAGTDLSANLIHFKGTALPGKPGNTVVFGHSTLPQLYNPKNYLTVFTYLTSLKKGDKILIDYDGIKYTYKIDQMFEVKPEDIEILEQKTDNSILTLVTCVPPGTYLRRLVVKSKLVPINKT